MIQEMRPCRGCDEDFLPDHGNQAYCSDDCYDENKKKKQSENNSLTKEFKEGFLGNYRLFCELQPDSGEIRIPLWHLLKTGFNQDAFYGTKLDSKPGKSWYKVNEYLFRIASVNNQPYLFLHKS